MRISVTERGTFKRCRRKWDFSSFNRQSLTRATTVSKALDLGTLVHKSLADWSIDSKADLVAIFAKHSSAKLASLTANYKRIVGANPNEEEFADIYDVIELGMAMMKNYRDYHKTPLPAHMQWVSPEQPVEVPIPGTEHLCDTCGGNGSYNAEKDEKAGTYAVGEEPDCCLECNGTGTALHFLTGTLDGLVQDTRDRLYILEHKTYGRRPRMETLELNDQFLAYIWLLTKLDFGDVGGIAYDGMWKRATPPKKNGMSDLFIRTVLSRTQDELDEFEGMLAAEAMDMASSPPLYMNRRWEGCGDCDYLKLCRAVSRGEDVGYIQKNFFTLRVKEELPGTEPVADEEEPY